MKKEELIKKIENAGYVKKEGYDTWWEKIWDAKKYYYDIEEIPKDVKTVVSRLYPDREGAEYILAGENGEYDSIAAPIEDDFEGVLEELLGINLEN